jgi:hypothetical protein
MTEIEVRIAAIEMVLTKVGALVDETTLDHAAETVHALLAAASPDERAIVRRALALIEVARDRP